MDSSLTNLSFSFLKKFDLLSDLYAIKALVNGLAI